MINLKKFFILLIIFSFSQSIINTSSFADCNTSLTNPINKAASDSCDVKSNKLTFIKSNLLSIGFRARFSSLDIIGSKAPEEFQEYDLSANFRLPWEKYSQSGWGLGTKLMTSIGALHAAGVTGLVVSFIPLVTYGRQDGRYVIDMGIGGALFSQRTFGEQDYGGAFQFALTAGASIPLFKRLGIGYRYQHYSDAGIYGPESTGADFHICWS
ncbi:MAG: acyloxyacyl hydrolase [Smithella sp.]